MLRNLPTEIESKLFEHCKDSYKRGIAVRRIGVSYSAIFLIVLLIGLALLGNVTDGFVVAITIAASSLCIVWAIYSVSASLNMQSDMITKLLIHYSEGRNS